MSHIQLVNTVIEGYKTSPIDMLGIGDAQGEYNYLNNLKDSYVRTIGDIDGLLGKDKTGKGILEIGSFLGAVSVSLRKLGYKVCALDIPEFFKSASLRSLYERNDIPFGALNLRGGKIPYESNSFDAVVICEVLEHLNFNPLPAVQELNRVLKKGGFIYIGMPNQSSITNRLKLLLGKSVHNPISDFFNQLDKRQNMVVGLHWREYTLQETCELIERMGFEVTKKYYFNEQDGRNENPLKALTRRLLFLYPPFRPSYVVVGKKVSEPNHDFWITDANS